MLKDKEYLFDAKLEFIKNPINLSFLNYKSDKDSLANLKLNGKFYKTH